LKIKNKIYTKNDQKAVELSSTQRSILKKAINAALEFEEIDFPCEISVSFVDNAQIQKLNAHYRQKDTPTDVLSFPLFEDGDLDGELAEGEALAIGDIVISVEKAVEQAAEYGHSFERELAFLAVHSVLHLLGYDHEQSVDDEEYMKESAEEILFNIGLAREGYLKPESKKVEDIISIIPTPINQKTAFISIIGRPNVGKSTLMNYILGEKVAIVSKKPQTTRGQIKGIYTKDSNQFVFLDTPGIHKPKNKLGEYMMKEANESIAGTDAVVFIVESNETPNNGEVDIVNKIKASKLPCILVINKVDIAKKDKLLVTMDNFSKLCDFKSIIPISALNGENVDILLKELEQFLKDENWFFPPDMITDQPERVIVAEIIREKLLRLLDEEIPHGIAVVIEEYTEKKDLVSIRAEIYCEKEAHKKIIIGKDGLALKKVATYAREDIEKLLGKKVYLNLWVKVKKNWRDSDLNLNRLGFKEEK